MAESIRLFLAGSFQHDTTSTLKISIGGAALVSVTVATGWYRTWLAATGGTGASDQSPKEYLAYMKSILDAASPGANWTVRMGSAGLVQLTYTGATYAITWDGTVSTDKKARSVLGFTDNIATTASGVFSTASAGPCFCVAGIGREADEYWQGKQLGSWEKMPTGRVYGWSSGLPELDRSFDVLYVPTDTGALTTLGLSTAYSPAYPDAARFTAPMTVPPAGLDFVYSWFDFVHAMPTRELGCAIASADGTNLTNFATVQSGISTKFDKCYLHPDSCGELKARMVARMYHPRRKIMDVRLTFISQPSVS